MTNPIIYPNQQYQQYPNQYSGVTINVTNPMMNAYPNGVSSAHPHNCNCNYCQPAYINQYPQQANIVPQNVNNHYVQYPQPEYVYATRHYQPEVAQSQDQQYLQATRHYQPETTGNIPVNTPQYIQSVQPAEAQYIQAQPTQAEAIQAQPQNMPNQIAQPQVGQPQPVQTQQAYPAQYYLNNYNILPGGINNNGENNGTISTVSNSYPEQIKTNEAVSTVENAQLSGYSQPEQIPVQNIPVQKEYNRPNVGTVNPATVASYQTEAEEEAVDMSVSENIINELDARAAIEKEKEANKEKLEIVALTNEYIMSLENYLNNPNKDIRLMAAKEILTRLNEDRDRYDDAALNALLNKMMQDPDKLVRVAAMSAFSSGLACGNDFTVKLLKDIQENPDASEDDAFEAANILLKMSTTTETKYVNSNIQPQMLEPQE